MLERWNYGSSFMFSQLQKALRPTRDSNRICFGEHNLKLLPFQPTRFNQHDLQWNVSTIARGCVLKMMRRAIDDRLRSNFDGHLCSDEKHGELCNVFKVGIHDWFNWSLSRFIIDEFNERPNHADHKRNLRKSFTFKNFSIFASNARCLIPEIKVKWSSCERTL